MIRIKMNNTRFNPDIKYTELTKMKVNMHKFIYM